MTVEVNSISLQEAETNGQRGDNPLVDRNVDLIGHINVQVRVEVGHIEMNVEDFFAAKSGDVLKMEQGLDEPVTLWIDEKPVARGRLVAIDDNFGVQITEIT